MIILRRILPLLLWLMAAQGQAVDIVDNGVNYDIVSFTDFTCKVVKKSGNGYVGDIVIPDSIIYNGKAVRVIAIDSDAFYDNQGLSSITLGNNIERIGSGAFYGCKSIQEIVIPDKVKNISSSAFKNCYGLKKVTIGASVEKIDYFAFANCNSVEELVIKDGSTTLELQPAYTYTDANERGIGTFGYFKLKTLYLGRRLNYTSDYDHGYSPFEAQKSLKEVTLGEAIVSVGPYLFSRCSALEKVTSLGDIITVREYAFASLDSLRTLNLGNSVKTIGDMAFYKCKKLESITLGDQLQDIGDEAFQGCSSLTEFQFPATLSSIGYGTFKECTSLTVVEIPAGEVGTGGFYSCDSLKQVVLGEDVKKVYYEAFGKCRSLAEVHFYGSPTMETKVFEASSAISNVYCHTTTPPSAGWGSFDNQVYMNATLHIPAGSADTYANAYIWQNFWFVEEDATAIHTVNADKGWYSIEGQSIHAPGASVFTLDGRPVKQDTPLPPAVYIIVRGYEAVKVALK